MLHLICIVNLFIDLQWWGGDFITDCQILDGSSYPKNISKFWNRINTRLDVFKTNMQRFAKCD